MEIEHLKSRNDALIKENQEKKEKADYWKLFCSEEKLRHGREQSEMQELLTDERTRHEEEISRLKRELESAQWDAKKLQLEAEEKQSEIQILKTRLENNVAPSCDHESVMEQQRQVIVAMENALFAQRSTTSASQEAKLARIPQVFQVAFDVTFSILLNLLLFSDGKGDNSITTDESTSTRDSCQ